MGRLQCVVCVLMALLVGSEAFLPASAAAGSLSLRRSSSRGLPPATTRMVATAAEDATRVQAINDFTTKVSALLLPAGAHSTGFGLSRPCEVCACVFVGGLM
jgi:hypothetical protein